MILIALQLLYWYYDKTTDLIVYQAARHQRLKPMIKRFRGVVLKTMWTVLRLPEGGRGWLYGKGDKEENGTKQEKSTGS